MGVLPLSSQELAARMNEQRQAIGETVDRLRARLRRELNLPRQLADHSRLAFTAAALAGFATGRLLRRLLG
ncbi:MAG: hypothetical protein ACRD13_01150 [Terriglobales bacterium]